MGDLNEIPDPNERQPQSNASFTRYGYFKRFISNNNLVDLGFQGNRFTWYNRRRNNQAVSFGPNRSLVNHLWIAMYRDATLTTCR